ncbi:superoxide dismutase family protein [Clostridium botulinum C]|uniref:Superoxide dismutase [Cu-Zn] n=3 Tax=Clostridium botulinum TaxID=1491 RepID=A0A9Q4TEK3_CLOBO|nr:MULTISPECIES: superoxide dismutase family protein [Clostridium]MCD3193967.1 superoxide dismutase family protein [Clostridium botulinum C]AYF55247.1 superoxide dismutase family protein [Clostridium novyi]KEI09370.1 superoxide dismutase [Clostridium sp. K25]MCD3199404.1 superoxide dismutase family protein [Clostridium botulinum C]MCD3204879.1 superoxide dismutase family protein [Clostridium botulinum C]
MFMYSNFENCNLNYNCECDPCCNCDPCYRNSSCKSTCNTMAVAHVNGGPHHPNLKGIVYFFPVPCGTEVSVCIQGLPNYKPATATSQPIGPFGFHIHSVGCCDIGDPENPFTCASGHWNPDNQPHGNHAGDFPVLFSNHGLCKMSFFTDRFKPQDVVGLSVIIHENPDDYRSQPSGNSGKRIACGLIEGLC